MSLQVCHCGWSKVTTYHGLRTHQGKMGCTARGVRDVKSQQQQMWADRGFTYNQKDSFSLDVYASVEIDYYSDTSLQVCHCGWSKVTTYHGLRTHQGKMGCTAKGMRIPEREQPAKRTTIKKETAPSPPSTYVYTSSAAMTTTVKEEYKSYFATSQHSTETAAKAKSRRRVHDVYDGVQVNRPVREHQAPTQPVTVVRPKEKHRKHQALSQPADRREMTGNWSINSRTNSATTAARVKEEPRSSSQMPQRSSQRATKPHDLSTGLQVNRSIRERPNVPPQVRAVQRQEKEMKDQTLSQVKSLVWEGPTTTYPAAVVRPKEMHRWDQTLSQNISPSISSAASVTIKEEPKSHFATPQRPFQKSTNSEASLQLQDSCTGVQVNRPVREHQTPTQPVTVVRPEEKHRKHQALSQPADRRDMTGNWSINSRTNSATTAARVKEEPRSPSQMPQRSSQRATKPHDLSTGLQNISPSISSAASVTIKEEPKSPFATPQRPFQKSTNSKASLQLQDSCTGVQVNRSSGERPTTPPPVKPKKKDREDQTLSQASQRRVKPELLPKPQLKKQKVSEIRQVERACESVPDSTSANTQINSAAEATTKEDTKSVCDTAQPDSSTGMKVKELAQMFSAPTTQERADQAKRKHRQEQKLSKVKHLAQKPSATTAQERAVQPKEKDEEVQKLSEVNRSSGERPTTPPPVKPKKKDREDQTLSQASQRRVKPELPPKPQLRKQKNDSTSATTQMNPASAQATTEEDPQSPCEAAQLSDSSTGLKVKELAQMFSASTTQATAAQPKGKDREEQRLLQVKLISQKLSASTAQETAVHPKEQDKGGQNRTQVKELARMFSATTTQETAVQPKGKDREKRKLSQVKELARMFSATTTQQTAVRRKEKDEEDETPS